MDALQNFIIVFISFFVVLYFSQSHEEGGVQRSLLVSVLIGLLNLLIPLGFLGYLIAVVGTFIILNQIQKYSFLTSFFVLLVGTIISQIIFYGVVTYF